jgi:membrane protease YdiL (CAAX protease family)
MTTALKSHTLSLQTVLLLAGFFASLILRLNVGGQDVARSAVAGIVFGLCLMALSLAAGLKTKVNYKVLGIGFVGGAFLIIPALLSAEFNSRPYGDYIPWAAIVAFVALAEEMFFRGVLFEAVKDYSGETAAVVLCALAFSALHIPLYGWHVLPLDFAVGIFLGMLRVRSGSWAAPGIAHVLADLAGWWLI